MAEQLVNEFTVNRPIDEAWAVITNVEQIATCLPGAELQEIEGDVYRGVVKVKLGSITPQFKGQATFIDRDDPGHRAVLKAEGRDTGGRGNAAAEITAQAESLSPTSTRCIVTTDLHITGRVAQFGRGILGDVSKKLMAQFASNLNTMLDDQGGAETPAAGNGDSASSTDDRCDVRRCPGRPAVGDRRPAARWRRAVGPRAPDPQDRGSRHRARRPRRRGRPGSAQAPRPDARRLGDRPHRVPATPLDRAAGADARGHERGHRRHPGRRVARPPARRALRRRRSRSIGESGGHPQRPVARRRNADADALLARRPRRGGRRQPARGRWGRSRRRGRGRRQGIGGSTRPLRRRA